MCCVGVRESVRACVYAHVCDMQAQTYSSAMIAYSWSTSSIFFVPLLSPTGSSADEPKLGKGDVMRVRCVWGFFFSGFFFLCYIWGWSGLRDVAKRAAARDISNPRAFWSVGRMAIMERR